MSECSNHFINDEADRGPGHEKKTFRFDNYLMIHQIIYLK